MIDLTGPARLWADALTGRFTAAHDAAARSRGCWDPARPDGDPRLLERLAEVLGADPERTTVTGGVRQFAAQWAGRTRTAVVELPSFRDVPRILSRASVVRREPWQRFAQVARALPEPTTFWLTHPVRNPDGRSWPGGKLQDLADTAAAGHPVVVNQVYGWFVPLAEAPRGTWVVRSLSKLCGGGSGLGWVTRPEAASAVSQTRGCGPATIWQRTWAGFLSAATLREFTVTCVEPTLAAAQAFAAEAAELLGWNLGGLAFSLTLAGHGATEDAMRDLLAGAGLLVSPGSAFDMPVTSVRLAFSGVTAAEARLAARCLARLAQSAPGGLSFSPWQGD